MTKWLEDFFKSLKSNTALIVANPSILVEDDPSPAVVTIDPAAVLPVKPVEPATGFTYIDSILDKAGMKAGRCFWGAVLTITVTFIYFT